MKRFIATIAALAFAFSPALAQGPGASIDATNAAQDDAIAALIIKNTAQDGALADLAAKAATREQVDAAIGLEIIDIKKRLDAIEAGTPPPVDPPPVDPPPVDPPPPPPPSGARSPLALGAPYHSTYWSHEDAFINHALVAGKDYEAYVAQGLVDEPTATFKKMPASGPLVIGLVRDGTTEAPSYYAGKWIADWQGDCDLSLNAGSVGDISRPSPNRIEEIYDPARHGTNPPQLVVTRIGSAGCKAIRYYRAEHETMLAAGKIFEPAWLARMARFDILRGMDWSGVNRALELTAAERPRANRPFYFDGRVPDAVIVRLAIEAGTELWVNAPEFLGTSPAAAGVVRSSTPTREEKLAAIKADAPAILATGERLAWARAIVAELNAQGYPLTRPLYVEQANEIWNTTFNFNMVHAWGVTRHLRVQFPTLRDSMRPGYGCLSGKLADAFSQALSEGGRSGQVWTLVLGAQTANVATTADAFAGLKACGTTQPMSRFGVATTNYYSGLFNWKASNTLLGAPVVIRNAQGAIDAKASEVEWDRRWIASLNADPAAHRALLNSYMLGPVAEQNVKWMAQQWRAHKAEAEKNGARWIGNYEGDPHNVMDAALKSDAGALALFDDWHESADHGRVIDAAVAELKAIDGQAIYANYAFCANGRQPGAPWVECSPWDQSGADNAAWDQLLKPAN